MNDLVQQLQAKAGLSPEQANKAAEVVAEFLENNVSGEQLQQLAGMVPGLSAHADKIPDDVGDKLGAAARGLFNRRD